MNKTKKITIILKARIYSMEWLKVTIQVKLNVRYAVWHLRSPNSLYPSSLCWVNTLLVDIVNWWLPQFTFPRILRTRKPGVPTNTTHRMFLSILCVKHELTGNHEANKVRCADS